MPAPRDIGVAAGAGVVAAALLPFLMPETLYRPDPHTGADAAALEIRLMAEIKLLESRLMHRLPPEATRARIEHLEEAMRTVIADFRPSAHVERLELMDLVAVKECTDQRFLAERFQALDMAEVNRRIRELKLRIGER